MSADVQPYSLAPGQPGAGRGLIGKRFPSTGQLIGTASAACATRTPARARQDYRAGLSQSLDMKIPQVGQTRLEASVVAR